MSTFKKLLALTLALAMVLSVSAFAGYTVAPYGDADKVDEDCEVAVQLLYSLNIMKGDDKGNFNPTATITRAEVAKMIYVILNYGKDDKAVNYTGAKLFSDVAAGAWYEGYVNYAATTKLVQGRGNGTFGPNDPVTTAEAAKMLLTAIGYSAEARGYVGAGWDKQVLSDAAIIGLLDGYNYSTTTYAPRQWVAVMFKNALTDAYTYGTIAPVIFNGLLNGTTLPSGDYKTMGEKYYNMADFEGVITANEYADLYGAETKSAGRTVLDDSLSLKVSSDLTEIGESRWGYYNTKTNEVYYIGDTGENTVFSTGDATDLSTSTKFKSATGIKQGGEYFVNFDKAAFTTTGNGDWLRVVDNNGDGVADYVFKTVFTMHEVTKVAADDTVYLSNNLKSDEYEMSEAVAAGDIVLYTKIDGVEYVELAESFTGEAEKYTFKTDALTVNGTDYVESDINEYTGYNKELELAKKDTEYTYYLDFFNHIRVFALPEYADGELVLLTDAYYATGRDGKVYAVDAYLNGEIADYDVIPASYSDYTMFINTITTDANAWDRLNEFAPTQGTTNLARYFEDDGALELYSAKTVYYDKQGNPTQAVKTDYIDLDERDVAAGATEYYGVDGRTRIQANKDTVIYYVYRNAKGEAVVNTVVGYKNSIDVVGAIVNIKDMYAVATNIESDSAKAPYWVADVIVIETALPVFNLDTDIVLGYNVVNRTVTDYAYLNVIDGTGALADLNVISLDGDKFNSFQYNYIPTPAFYFNTVDEDGNSYIIKLGGEAGDNQTAEFDWGYYNIFAKKIDRVVDLYEYVVTTDAETFYFDENTVVYDIDKGSDFHNTIKTVDGNKNTLALETGCEYILVTDGYGYVIYAVLVEAYDDITAALYEEIGGAVDELGAAKAAAIKVLTDWAAEVEAFYGLTEGALSTTLDEQVAAVKACESKAAVAAICPATREEIVNPADYTGVDAIADKGAELKAAQDLANATYTLTVVNGTGSYVIIDGVTLTTADVEGLTAGQSVVLTAGAPVAVVAGEGATAVMNGNPTSWVITVTGNATIQVNSIS